MFEARLTQGILLKKIVEAIRDLVTEGNLDCTENGIALQAMDSSHVSLCALNLRADGFDHFRCDRSMALGLNLANLGKILKCAGNEDIVTLKSQEEGDMLTIMFESPNQDRISDFEMKLMDIDVEHLGIPEQEYNCTIKMPAGEFQRIIRDLGVLGDTCTISVTKEGVKFSVSGDLGTGNVMLRNTAGSAEKEADQVVLEMDEPCELTFAVRYLTYFTKATSLGGVVTLSMSPDVPIVVEYPIENVGFVRFYLAPKLDEEA
jgi:proliferating cell nuclear antigen